MLATVMQAPPPTPPATTPSTGAMQTDAQLKIESSRPLYLADAAAVLWLERRDGDLAATEIDPLWSGIATERFEQPVGDGVWVQLLDRRLNVLGSFRGAVPPPDGRCGQEIPVVRGTWWVLFIERSNGQSTFLGQLEVGPELIEVVERNRLPVQ
jgi:hypothetical protein